jgi:hypothetical protein
MEKISMLIVEEIKFDPEDGGSIFLRNIFIRLQYYTVKNQKTRI